MPDVLRYEDAATRKQFDGWACVRCSRFHYDEHSARYCCHTEGPCRTGGCSGRTHRRYMYCDACMKRRDDERWKAMPQVGYAEQVVAVWRDDTFFFDVDSLLDWLNDRTVDTPSAQPPQLVVCQRVKVPYFDLSEWLSDRMELGGEEFEVGRSVEDQINDLIRAEAPTLWEPTDVRIDPATLPRPTTEEAQG